MFDKVGLSNEISRPFGGFKDYSTLYGLAVNRPLNVTDLNRFRFTLEALVFGVQLHMCALIVPNQFIGDYMSFKTTTYIMSVQ